jgi:hypothetical protein
MAIWLRNDDAHGVQAIGKLEENDAGVFRHTNKHLAHRLCLLAAQRLTNAPLFLIAFLLDLIACWRMNLRSHLLCAFQDIEPQHTAHDTRHWCTKYSFDLLYW